MTDYQFYRQLGAGGFGVVYEVERSRDGLALAGKSPRERVPRVELREHNQTARAGVSGLSLLQLEEPTSPPPEARGSG